MGDANSISRSAGRWRLRLAAAVPAVLLVGLIGRLVYIQRAMAADFAERIAVQHEASYEIPARRGMILDTRGRVLAGSKPVFTLIADPFRLLNNPLAFNRLAEARHLTEEQLYNLLSTSAGPRSKPLERGLSPEAADDWVSMRIEGIGVEADSKRIYPMGSRLAHVLGFVGAEGHGMEGLELAFEQHLSGTPGKQFAMVTAARKAIAESEEPIIPPVDGGHLVLTIDSVIQEITERALAESIAKFDAKGGVSIVMDPTTGDVLAMASWPTFLPEEYGKATADARRNRALTDPLEPGSMVKPLVAAAAVASGAVQMTDSFDCGPGERYFGKRLIHDTKPNYVLTTPNVIVKSSNIGMAQIGERLGGPRLSRVIRDYGFGLRTGIELPGEDEGIVTPRSKWTSYTTQSVPFGQEISVTPIQMITAFSALVNDGYLMKPRLIKARLAGDGSVLESDSAPEPVRQVVPTQVARQFREEVLPRVVTEGSGKPAAVAGYKVLGKTGTAQVASRSQKGYAHGTYISSFIGAAPSKDPRLVVLVMIREPDPSKGYYGRHVSAPVTGNILRESLAYLEVPHEVSPEEQNEMRLVQSDVGD